MICPKCRTEECRRSHREGWRDLLIGLTGLRPWRCRACEARFYAWAVPMPYQRFTHCRLCGNLGVKRISREYVTGYFAWAWRAMRLPAYRCASCRYKFFSIRRQYRVVSSPQSEEADSAAAARGK